VRCYFRSAAVTVVALLAASRGDQRFLAAGSDGFEPRCWVDTDGWGYGSSERKCRSLFLAALLTAALLKTARGEGV
jgi:hypothetical protein